MVMVINKSDRDGVSGGGYGMSFLKSILYYLKMVVVKKKMSR